MLLLNTNPVAISFWIGLFACISIYYICNAIVKITRIKKGLPENEEEE